MEQILLSTKLLVMLLAYVNLVSDVACHGAHMLFLIVVDDVADRFAGCALLSDEQALQVNHACKSLTSR